MIIAVLPFASAHAADLGARVQPPVVAAAYNWSGFYAGLNAGGAWGHSNMSTATTDDLPFGGFFGNNTALFNAMGTQRASSSGFTGGGQVGFNWQAGNTILGIETDFQSFRQNANSTASFALPVPVFGPIPYTISQSISTDWLWTLRPRVGFAIDNWLLYATGGIAVADVKANSLVASPDTVEASAWSKTRVGWTAGAGVEVALNRAWSVKAEYLYVDLGNATQTTHNLIDEGIPSPSSRSSTT